MNFENSKYILVSKLRECREFRKMTQKELADAVGCSQNSISSLESGKVFPSLLMAVSIGRVLKMSVYDIWTIDIK